MWCFNCSKNVNGEKKDFCKEKDHELDEDNLWDHKKDITKRNQQSSPRCCKNWHCLYVCNNS